MESIVTFLESKQGHLAGFGQTLQCAGGVYQTLSFDKEKDAERALSLLRERRPDLPGAPEGKGIGSSIL